MAVWQSRRSVVFLRIILVFPYLSGLCFFVSLCNLDPHDRFPVGQDTWSPEIKLPFQIWVALCRDTAWCCGRWATRVSWCVPTLQPSSCCGGTAENPVTCGGVPWSFLPWLTQRMGFLPVGHLVWRLRRKKSGGAGVRHFRGVAHGQTGISVSIFYFF